MPPPPLLPRLYPTPPPIGARDRGRRALPSPGRRRRPAHLAVVRAKGKDEASFTDRILDYIEGGPKLRRWYGAPDLLPKDGGAEDEEGESPDIEEPRDTVLVTDGDSEIGQMVILALILKRARIKAVVKDKRSTEEAFGTYVECMVGDMEDKSFSKKALKGVRAVISPADDGFFSEPIDLNGVEHIVLLSQLAVYRSSGGLQAIMNSKLKKLAERDEEVVLASGIPSTIIRTGSLQSTPGGERGFDFTEGVAAKGRISKEDAATICVEALDGVPQKTLIFEVQSNLVNQASGLETVAMTGIPCFKECLMFRIDSITKLLCTYLLRVAKKITQLGYLIVQVANGDEKVSDWKAWFAERLKKNG